MPQQICETCLFQLQAMFDFKTKCQASLQYLYSILLKEESKPLKKELECNTTSIITQEDLNIKQETHDGFEDVNSDSSEDFKNEQIENERKRSLSEILIKKYKIYDKTCNICHKEISTRTTLLRHMEIHDTNRVLKYACKICSKGFYALENLKKHELRHLGQTKYQCDLCPKRFYVLSALGVHCKSSHKIKPINCRKCSQQFYHKLQIEQHELIHKEKRYVCEDCGKIFPTKNRLTKHKVFHSESRPHACSLCPQSFKQKSDLTAHIKKRHEDNENREMCYICGKLVLLGCLTIHLEIHKERSFKCIECNKLYSSKLILSRHVKLKHNNFESEKYYCDICNKELGSKGSLSNHMINIHSEMRKSDCPICGKTYKSQNGVKLHIQSVHKNERPHCCEICNKAFHTKKILEKHMRTHTGEKPFSCNICGKSFGFKEVLKTHMKVHSK